jgi:hypothetical protein
MFFSRLWNGNGISRKHVVEVGWVLQTDHARFIWDTPRLLKRQDGTPEHAKSVVYCPAVIDQESRLFEVACPFDLHLRMRCNEAGEATLIDVAGDQSGMTPRSLMQLTVLSQRKQWRHPDRPILQFKTPYTFIADEPVFLSQMPPFLTYRDPPWPGIVIGGRIPIHVWPRPLSWAFEWHDVTKDFVLQRGQPWFYIRFETMDASRHVRLVEAELTAELRNYFAGINGVTNYTNGTFSLFQTAQARRPKQLLVKARR